MSHRSRRFLPWLALCFAFSACDDEEADPNETAAAPVFVDIVSITAAQGSTWTPDGESRFSLGCDAAVVVEVAIRGEFLLRPPGGCGATPQCGFLRVIADTDGRTVPLQTDLVSHFALLQLAPGWAGTTRFRAQLMVDGETPYLNADGAAAASAPLELDLIAPESCDAEPGVGGAAGAPAAGGADGSVAGGAGGASAGGGLEPAAGSGGTAEAPQPGDGGTAAEGGESAGGESAGGESAGGESAGGVSAEAGAPGVGGSGGVPL